MIVPVYRTWVAGEVVTAAYFNSNVRDAGNFWLSVPTAVLRQTVAQSMTSGSGTAVTFDTEDLDNDNGHSVTTNTSRYNPQTPGRFQFSGAVGWVSSAAGGRITYWAKNGTPFNASQNVQGGTTGGVNRLTSVTMDDTFNGTTDYLELFGLQSSGGALSTDITTGALGGQSKVHVRWIGTT